MSQPSRTFLLLWSGLLLLGATSSARSQEEGSAPERKSGGSALAVELSPDDVLLPVTSIEWGVPDRWSFTARYLHMFGEDRDNKSFLNNFTLSLSPGTAGGRLGIGWQAIFGLKGRPDVAFFTEARAVLLRTWGNPLETEPNRTFAGAELRGAIVFILNLGVGYYRQISSHQGPADSFWGYHIGIGI